MTRRWTPGVGEQLSVGEPIIILTKSSEMLSNRFMRVLSHTGVAIVLERSVTVYTEEAHT